jgi:hypothetical protein
MKVSNLIYNERDYLGRKIECPNKECPCLPCFTYHGSNLKYNWRYNKWQGDFCCLMKEQYGCPTYPGSPTHVFFNTPEFKKRRTGDKFKCLRCGKTVVWDEMGRRYNYVIYSLD